MEIKFKSLLVLQVLAMFAGAKKRSHPGPAGYLVCDTGVTLQILRNKTITGTTNADDPFVVQFFRSSNTRGILIYGRKSRNYLCFTKRNKAIARRHRSAKCWFEIDKLNERHFSLSRTVKSRRTYFGLSKSGKPRTGPRNSSRTKFTWVPINYKEIQNLDQSKDWLNLYSNLFDR